MLGLSPTASASEIKKQYKRLVKKWHPDKWAAGTENHVNATEKMKMLNESFQLIKEAPLQYENPTQAVPENNPKIRPMYRWDNLHDLNFNESRNTFHWIGNFFIGVAIGFTFLGIYFKFLPNSANSLGYGAVPPYYESGYAAIPVFFGLLAALFLDKALSCCKKSYFILQSKTIKRQKKKEKEP